MPSELPSYDVDMLSEEVLADPQPHYRRIRDLGPVVWLGHHEIRVAARYREARDVLRTPEVFSSSHGVALSGPFNNDTEEMEALTTLTAAGEAHARLRSVLTRPMSPPRLGELVDTVHDMAEQRVLHLLERESFDGVTDFAQYLPVELVSHLVGLPESGRERMLAWSDSIFNVLGGLNERSMATLEIAIEMVKYAFSIERSTLRPGSWAALLFEAADAGEIDMEQVPLLIVDYVGPALDTTIHATSHLLHLIGRQPDQWALVRADPDELIDRAVEEVLRYEAPVRGFSRMTVAPFELDGVNLEPGERIWVLNASANRDERQFEDPDRFDVTRRRNNHLAFGAGPHVCAGAHLARLEMRSLLAAMVRHVEHIEVGTPVPAFNNMLHGYERMDARFS